ncbi:MAG: mechanosensitive ion channel family protein [Symploca sp. SIO1B1]|nr:mechanosensitive ion channel family protein [Symploca sp. SIO1C2]NER49870.1 mechanosensitive ion channel family protein [Symploca sp. SIO1A3]NER94475.1 mechanosensitive ion channel family protein [Symploca sp. SIO1B1]
MSQLLETIYESLRELVASSIIILPAIITALIIIMLTRFFAQFAQEVATKVGKKTIHSKSLQLLLAKTSYVAAWVVGSLMAAVIAFPGLQLGDIIATLGLSSVAIGFAFQDIFKNFLAGILLLLQEPFRISDQVIIGDYEGTVEHIDIRTTQIRTYTGEQVLLPNSTVFTSAVQVRTAFSSRRTDLGVGVDYNTPLPETSELLQQIISDVDGVLDNPPPEIDLVSFGDSSIDFVVRYWTLPQQEEVQRIQTKAIVAIKKAFDQANISIPYPIRTLYYYDQQKFNDYFPISGTEEDKP